MQGDAEIARLKERLAQLDEAAGCLIRALRPDGRPCLLCVASVGEKHGAACPVWPFILARHFADTGEIIEQIAEPEPTLF